MLDPDRAAGVGVDHDDALVLAGLAEVQLQRAAGVPGGDRGAGDGLGPVDVAQRRVADRRQGAGFSGVGVGDVDAALGVRRDRAAHVQVRGEDQDVPAVLVPGAQPGRQPGLHVAQVPGVVPGGGTRTGEAVQEPVLVDERQRGQPDPLIAPAGRVIQDPAVARMPGPGHKPEPGRRAGAGVLGERVHGEVQGLHQRGRVVVAGQHDDRGDARQVVQHPQGPAQVRGGRPVGIEQVAAVDDQVRPGLLRDAGDLGQHRVEVLIAGPPSYGPPQVPVRGVQQPHRRASARGRET